MMEEEEGERGNRGRRRRETLPRHISVLLVFTLDCHCCLVAKLCLTLWQPHGRLPARLLCPWDFPGENTGVGKHFLLQGISRTQGLDLGLLHWQVGSLLLGSPYTGLESPDLPTTRSLL